MVADEKGTGLPYSSSTMEGAAVKKTAHFQP